MLEAADFDLDFTGVRVVGLGKKAGSMLFSL